MFVAHLKRELAQHVGGLSEHQLIQSLYKAGLFDGWVSADPTLGLFHKHFAVMHSLYRLQPQYAEQGQRLFISPLRIQLLPAPTRPASNELTSGDAVRGFYLDWSHFTSATPDSVVQLLRDFWERYGAVDKTSAALQDLDLESGANWAAIQAQYRRLAAEHHPDRGGDKESFARVREAYEVLRVSYKPQAVSRKR